MFGVSFTELVVIMLVMLIFLGPDKLPEAARTLGRLMAIFKRNSDALRREFYNTVYEPAADLKKQIDLTKRDLFALENKDPKSLNCEEKTFIEEAKKKKLEEEKAASDKTTPAADTASQGAKSNE